MYILRSKLIYPMVAALLMIVVISANCFAAPPRDIKKGDLRRPAAGSQSVPRRPTNEQVRASGIAEDLPALIISSFRKRVQIAPGAYAPILRPGTPTPTSARIELGDDITLLWIIEFRHADSIRANIPGVGNIRLGPVRTASNGVTYYRGEFTIRPSDTTTYTLTATANPTASNIRGNLRANKSFTVNVSKPRFEILDPTVRTDPLGVEVLVRNVGESNLSPTAITVHYELSSFGGRSNFPITDGSFTTRRMGINRGQRVSLGRISLGEFRDRVFSTRDMNIVLRVTADDVPAVEEASKRSRHRWREQTSTIRNSLLQALASGMNCDVRLNNYNPSRPAVPRRDDSFVHLSMPGNASEPYRFTIPAEVYRIRVTGKLTGHDYINMRVAFLVNAIESASEMSADLLTIRNGKLGIHLEFPNTGRHEIKLGSLEGSNFDDDEVPDLNIGSFSVDAWLTPVVSNNRISYSAIDVNVPEVSASLSGRFDGLNPFIRRYLSDYVTSQIRSQLNSILGSDRIKRTIEDALTNTFRSVNRSCNYITNVRGSGDSIIVNYR